MRTLAAFAGLLLLAPIAQAWTDTGHMVITAIAERDLRPEVREQVLALSRIGGDARTNTFLTGSVWADENRTDQSGPWHYINLYFRPDGKPAQGKPLPENAVVAIERFSKVLADRSRPEAERAEALRYLTHFVADLHQPLHAVARETDARPQGDRGGNDFAIQSPEAFRSMARPPRNLHFLWDIGAGLFLQRYERPLAEDSEARVRLQAWTLTAALPRTAFSNVGVLTPMAWAEEGLALAKTTVYDLEEGSVPSEAYLARAREASAKRATLAGYRLADLLNKLLG